MIKMKIVSLSFDEGTIYDLRFIELLNKYNIRATLNLNSELDNFVWYFGETPIERLKLNEVVEKYDGHEVCSHSLTHPYFSSLSKEEIIRQVKEDCENLSKIFNRDINAFAFPFHDQTEEHIQILKENLNLNYIRYSYFEESYLPKDRYHIPLNALYNDNDLYEKLENFKNNDLDNSLFVIAGHSYEFEVRNEWERIEELLKYLSSNKDIVVLPLIEAINVIFTTN